MKRVELKAIIDEQLANMEIVAVHTHLYPADIDGLLLWGIDEILTYQYLIAEYIRYSYLEYRKIFRLHKARQAELVWQTLFLDRSPVCEAQRGVLTILNRLGLDVKSRSLEAYREYYRGLTLLGQIDQVFRLAGV